MSKTLDAMAAFSALWRLEYTLDAHDDLQDEERNARHIRTARQLLYRDGHPQVTQGGPEHAARYQEHITGVNSQGRHHDQAKCLSARLGQLADVREFRVLLNKVEVGGARPQHLGA